MSSVADFAGGRGLSGMPARWLKRLAASMAAAAALLAMALALAWAVFDADWLRAELVRAVREQKSRTLRIDGEVTPLLWPAPGLRLGGVRLSERGSDEGFAAAQAVTVAVAPGPLLRREAVIRRIEIDGLDATVVRRADGTLNIADLLERDPAARLAVRLDPDVLRLNEGRLVLRDERAGRTLRLDGLTVAAQRTAGAEGRIELSGRLGLTAPQADLALSASAGYRLSTQWPDAALAGPQIALRGNATELGEIEMRVAAARVAPEADGVALEAPAFEFRAHAGARELALRAEAPRLVVGNNRLEAIPVRLALDGRDGDTAVRARVESPLAAAWAPARFELPRLAGTLELAHPALARAPLRLPFSGQAGAAAEGAAEFALDTLLSGSPAHARVRLERLAPPAGRFTVELGRLDLDALLGPPRPGRGADRRGADLSALERMGLHGSVKIGELRAAGTVARDFSLTF